jgi:hypothetical protein
LEARVGIEPTHKGFADLSLTTWVPRPEHNVTPCFYIVDGAARRSATIKLKRRFSDGNLERETGFEPATSTLARSHSTTELLPLSEHDYKRAFLGGQTAQK